VHDVALVTGVAWRHAVNAVVRMPSGSLIWDVPASLSGVACIVFCSHGWLSAGAKSASLK
jgi:hypothetical protein